MKRSRIGLALAMVGAVLMSACSPSESPDASEPDGSAAGGEAATVQLQLQWTPQAQFGGYYAAQEQGYYEEENLTVEFLPGGGDIVPQQVGSAPDGPEFTIAWVPKVLQAREAGSDLVQIAQVFQRAATLAVSWGDSGILLPEDWEGKRVGAWPFGNELEVIATATLAGLTEGEDYTRVEQDFDMSELLAAYDGCEASDTDCVDVAEAMVYNEYAQLLETTNPDTGELFTPADLNVLNYNDYRHRHAPGRAVGPRVMAGRGGERGRRDPLPAGLVPRLDLLPREPRRLRPVLARPGQPAGARVTSAG